MIKYVQIALLKTQLDAICKYVKKAMPHKALPKNDVNLSLKVWKEGHAHERHKLVFYDVNL